MSDSFISLVIEQMSASDFEAWCQKVLEEDKKYRFEPTGGMHDGGQDGFVRPVNGEINHYVQISKEKRTSEKIRRTLRRLLENRSVNCLTYITSQYEPNKDLLEAKLKSEFEIDVIIHDKRWLVVKTQLNDRIEDSLYEYSRDLVDEFYQVQNSRRRLDTSSRLSVVFYLEAHVKSLSGTEDFQKTCVDTLIYNALSGTDPDANKFMTPEEIEEFINGSYPNVIAKSGCTIEERLTVLSSKTSDPRIRNHPNNKYALPNSVRDAFSDDNLRLKGIEDYFVGSLNHRLNQLLPENDNIPSSLIIECVQQSFLETYQTQAINFAAFLSNNIEDNITDIRVYEIIDKIVSNMGVDESLSKVVKDISSKIFRNICYSSNEDERAYLNLLFKFYTIKFVMDGDRSVNKYFSDVASNLRIYIGTDIVVRCLSEALVKEPSKGMTNSLKLLSSAGVRFRITRQTVEEVLSHIRHSTGVFRSEYESWYRAAKLEHVMNSDRILIRAFFYAYLEPNLHIRSPGSWRDYLKHFGSPSWFYRINDQVKDQEYTDSFTAFLRDKYQLEFCEIDDVISGIDGHISEKVTKAILQKRYSQTDGDRILARNDAHMALFINSERRIRGEHVSPDIYGFNTWWLTEETAVLRALKQCGQRNDVVMHPQFLMNYFILDPNFIKQSLGKEGEIMPTLFGLRITDRVSPDDMKDFLRAVGDIAGLDEAGQNARIREASNKLKRGI